MKTAEEISKKIKIIETKDKRELSDKDIRKLKTELCFLRKVLMYLDTNPSESFIASELTRKQGSLDTINDSFEVWVKHNPDKIVNIKPAQQRSKYNTEMGVSKIKKQIKTLKFILK